MYSKKQRPSWWLLYLCLPMMIGLFLLEMRLSLSETEHRLAELIIFLVVIGGIKLWLEANKGALIQEDLERWHAALGADTTPISPPSIKIPHTNSNMSRQPRHVRESIYGRLAGWTSAISAFFH